MTDDALDASDVSVTNVATALFSRLHISDDGNDAAVEEYIRGCKPANASTPIILCDAFYGFPSQKRPRNEKVRAVSRQLVNFLQWRSEASEKITNCHIHVLGEGKDVEAVKSRVNELKSQTNASISKCEINFQQDIDIHKFLDQQHYTTSSLSEVVYLSPDATYSLPTISRPPRVVIVGMPIDRRITEGRSRRRAEDLLNIRAAKLPLDELSVKELSSSEPLNVDTVMELMQRWWNNCDKLEQRIHDKVIENDDSNTEALSQLYKRCFLEAAAWSMKSQRDRHPNRTLHKTDY